MSYAKPHPLALSSADVARMCGVSAHTVRKWARLGLMPHYFIPTEAEQPHARYEKSKVLAFMAQHGIPNFADER